MEKPFYIFAGDNYYPSGGFNDFKGAFVSLEEAKEAIVQGLFKNYRYDWYHIVDVRIQEIVYK